MAIHNADIAAMFDEIADFLDIQDDNPFRIRAYRNASRTVGDLGREIRDMLEKGEDLTTLPGIGADLAAKIKELAETGKVETLEKLRKQFPPGIKELLKIPNLGPKRVKTLFQDLKIDSLAKLEKAAKDGRIRTLAGFGEKMETHILDSVKVRADTTKRFLRAWVTSYIETLLEHLEKTRGVKEVIVAGSYRRAKETVGDIDILAIADAGSPVMDRFVQYDEVAEVLSHGETKSNVILKSGIQADLRVVEPESFGAALVYFTGSKAHNIAIRKRGQDRGLKINEYGVFKGKRSIAGKTEADVYKAVALPYIPPELREDSGEIEAALEGRLPRLIEPGDLKGDLHMHTMASDGRQTMRELVEAARHLGYEYIAITEHSKRLAMTGGLDEHRLLKQIEEIDKLNETLKDIVVLKGIEVDILENGTLDLSDDALGKLDLVIGSVHSHFKMPVEKQTERILRAMDHPYFTMLGHPSGRLLLEREPYEVDMERVIQHARDRGCFLELNANAQRLDLNDVYCRMAREEKVFLCINTDAHSIADLGNIPLGINQARRGWLEKKDVLNTRPLKLLKPLLARTMGKRVSK